MKHKRWFKPQLSAADLRARVQSAIAEGRYQQALQLAKDLHKVEPTPAHQELLLQAHLGRAQQLRQQGATRDAATVLHNARALAGSDPAWLERLAEELALCGDARAAVGVLEHLPDSPAQARVLGRAVDAALAQGQAGRALLPASLQGPFDLVRRAFAQAEAGQDEQARETLQDIGLRSPFLEWKLLLRGLIAYYQNDDPRALENWQRLNPERLPARLAAPLRFAIDPAYRLAQPPEAQAHLQQQSDRLLSSGVVPSLRLLQATLGNEHQLATAFRQADGLLPALKQQAAHLVPRLAACFYWAIVDHGQPEDMTRYRRVFGLPPDDPQFDRLQALVMEKIPDFAKAHVHWQQFEKWVAGNPAAWPGDQARQVRALVWAHMGHNAASLPSEDQLAELPAFLRDHPARPRPLKPTAEQCYRRSLELDPDRLETYEVLFQYYQQRDDDDRAEEAARQLLERFPDHVPTLEALGDLRMQANDYAEALTLFRRALQANPLDRELRARVSTAHTFHARTHAEAGRFEEARAEYRAALAFQDRQDDASVLCKWAACEFKAGDTARAEELLRQAAGAAGSRLEIAYSMLIETIRLKLPRPLKARFDQEFKEALAEPPTGAGAAAVAETAAAHQLAGVTYHGQKTHEKKVLAYLKLAHGADFTEEQLQQLCTSLLHLNAQRLTGQFTWLGRERFPRNPHFPLLQAEMFLAMGPGQGGSRRAGPLLEEARRLAEALPPDARQKELLDNIRQRQEALGALNLFGRRLPGMFGEMMDQLFAYYEDDDWDEDDDDDFLFVPRRRRRKPKRRQKRR